jgi:hypothetical protein
MTVSRTEAGLTGAFVMVLFFAAVIVGFNVKAIPEGHSIQPDVVAVEVDKCDELEREAVALERCHDTFNCVLYPEDFRRGIAIFNEQEALNCERETIKSPKKGSTDKEASGSIGRRRT